LLDIVARTLYAGLVLVVLGVVVVLASKSKLVWATYLYLLRVPLLVAVGIFAFFYIAILSSSDAKLLLNGAFDIESYPGIFWVSFVAFLSVSAVEIAWRLIYLYGYERFFVEVVPGNEATSTDEVIPSTGPSNMRLPILVYVVCNLLAVLVTIGAVYVSTNNLFHRGQCEDLTLIYQCTVLEWPKAVRWVLGGIGLYASLMIVLTIFQLIFTRSDVASASSADLFLPAAIWPLRPWFDWLRNIGSPIGPTEGTSERLWAFSRSLGRGYILYPANGAPISVAPGHIAALILLALTGGFYVAVGHFDHTNVKEGSALNVPALGYVLLLFTLLCWLLSSLTFFLDRYRIPVLIPLILVLFATSHWLRTEEDYLFETKNAAMPATTSVPTPTSIVVVATNGGGIQSAAWTARVLTGLEEECRKFCDSSFAGSVRLISSVSGGSVGTMYFVNEYEQDGSFPQKKVEWNAIVGRAEGSSLDHIAWGLLYPDLVRMLWPYEPEWDRGRALQRAWLRIGTGWDNSMGIKRGLTKWQKDADRGRRPAVIFNTTVAETGKPLVLATTDLPDDALTREEFLGANTDVSVLTATRLSAAYPYVSPAARAEPHPDGSKKTTYHVVDGGYYDNFGVSSLVSWLDEELKQEVSIEKVLVVKIRGAPPKDTEKVKKRGWFYQALAPGYTALKVRGAGQSAHAKTELDLLIDKWCGNDQRPPKEAAQAHEDSKEDTQADEDQCVNDDRHIDIETAEFEFDEFDTPLSWHLTNEQKQAIEDGWTAELCLDRNRIEGWAKVRQFLGKRGAEVRECPPQSQQ
jgi:hypothetical protein